MSESKIGRGSLTGNVLRGMTSSSTGKEQRDKEQPGLIPMSLFAAWDADRTPPNCVPRYLKFYLLLHQSCLDGIPDQLKEFLPSEKEVW